jgi:hypothetical protein
MEYEIIYGYIDCGCRSNYLINKFTLCGTKWKFIGYLCKSWDAICVQGSVACHGNKITAHCFREEPFSMKVLIRDAQTLLLLLPC